MAPKGKPFPPDVVAASLLAAEWILLPVALLVYALAIPPGPNPTEIGMEKNGFLLLLATVGWLFLMVFGWVCLRVRDGRRIGLIAAAVIQVASLGPPLMRGVSVVGVGLVPPLAVLLFVVARFAGWGPRPA